MPPFCDLKFKWLTGDQSTYQQAGAVVWYRQVGGRHYHMVEHDVLQRGTFLVHLWDVDLKRINPQHLRELSRWLGVSNAVLLDLWQQQPLVLAQMLFNARYGVLLACAEGQHSGALLNEVAKMSEPLAENMFTVTRTRGTPKGELRVRLQGRYPERRAMAFQARPLTGGVPMAVNLTEASKQVHSPRPLLYVYGYLRAVVGEKGTPNNLRAQDSEYIRGYNYGKDVALGRARQPAWHSKGEAHAS